MSKILYAASSAAHLDAFHTPYIEALRSEGHTVKTLGGGAGTDFNIAFEKKYLSKKNANSRAEVKKILEEEDFDVIIVNTSLAAFHIRRALPSEKRPRLVNIVHGYLFPEFASGIKGGLRKLMLLSAEKMLRKKTDALIVMNSEDLRIATMENLTNTDPYLINGMGIPPLRYSDGSPSIKKELGLESKHLLTFVGELSKRKNQAFLIEAMPEILKSIPNAHLLLVGDGALKPYLSELIKKLGLSDSVTLLGKRRDVADILSDTDLYVSASKSEGLPFNIVEALAAGKQIVASATKGQTDILDDGAGILYEANSREDYVKAVSAVYLGDMRSEESAIKEAYEKYSLDTVFPETLAAIKEAACL